MWYLLVVPMTTLWCSLPQADFEGHSVLFDAAKYIILFIPLFDFGLKIDSTTSYTGNVRDSGLFETTLMLYSMLPEGQQTLISTG